MTGAIEFLKAWRDLCKEEGNCLKCPVWERCKVTVIRRYTDKNITELVRSVMAQSRKAESEETNADSN